MDFSETLHSDSLRDPQHGCSISGHQIKCQGHFRNKNWLHDFQGLELACSNSMIFQQDFQWCTRNLLIKVRPLPVIEQQKNYNAGVEQDKTGCEIHHELLPPKMATQHLVPYWFYVAPKKPSLKLVGSNLLFRWCYITHEPMILINHI